MPTTPVAIEWECLANGLDDERFAARLVLRNVSDMVIAPGWTLYFNTCRKVVPETVSAGFAMAHVNGDLFRLRAAAAAPWPPGDTYEITYQSRFWAISRTDAPLGFYLVTADGQARDLGDPHILPFIRPAQLQRRRDDQVPPMDAARRFAENGAVFLLPPEAVGRITPRPLAAGFTEERCRIGADTLFHAAPGLENEAASLRALLATLPPAHGATTIVLELGAVDAGTPAPLEAYLLEIDPERVRLRGASAHGVFNGIQTLRQLAGLAGSLPCGHVRDAPRFAYRGMMLDAARHFADVDTVLRLLDCMALYKLNRFHFHLTDDEGWRLPITALPELTEVGARRGVPDDGDGDGNACLPPSFGSGARVDASAGSGHYSHDDFIAILRHAQARHIEVIPEFNMPGHARAAVQAMRVRHARLLAAGDTAGADACRLDDPDDASVYESVQLWHDNVICIARDSADRFVDTVVAEVAALFRQAGVLLRTVHLGGDEVPAGAWLGSPICRARMARHGWTSVHELRADFTARCRAILARHGLAFAGWDDNALVASGEGVHADPRFVGPGFQVYVWNNATGSGQEDCAWRLANAGYDVVLANAAHLYFDLAHAKDPQEPGYYWAGFIDTRTAFTFCPLDLETVPGRDQMGRPLGADAAARLVRLAAPARILGLQGQLWGENAISRARIEYLAAPRLLALAERAWSPDPCWSALADEAERARRIDADWNEFANRLGRHALPQLDRALAYGYRLPPPGVLLHAGRIHANVALPGLVLRYRLDGAAPDADSPRYGVPLALPSGGASFTIASFDTRGRSSRVITLDLKDGTDA
ncbi:MULTISPECIES: family 20 glycosylhydrolase [unclassified Massilia]|uniref:family 20 glycosylhydrolase n=1 Tax=unclassified Massilia TaxID=2609279 RepID=UPI001E5B335A|nr:MULTISPECIES: family 20 glycosylhydrolase [unclassified Massilia]